MRYSNPDASQRLLVVEFLNHNLSVMKAETLLRLAQEWKDRDVPWEEWEDHATWVTRDTRDSHLWVSDPRLCCVFFHGIRQPHIDVYDFSPRTSLNYTETIKGRIIRQPAPGASKSLPWEVLDAVHAGGYHDGIVFLMAIKIPHPSNSTWN